MQEYSVELVWDRPSQHGTHSAVPRGLPLRKIGASASTKKHTAGLPAAEQPGFVKEVGGPSASTSGIVVGCTFSRRSKIRSFLTASYEIPGILCPGPDC